MLHGSEDILEAAFLLHLQVGQMRAVFALQPPGSYCTVFAADGSNACTHLIVLLSIKPSLLQRVATTLGQVRNRHTYPSKTV